MESLFRKGGIGSDHHQRSHQAQSDTDIPLHVGVQLRDEQASSADDTASGGTPGPYPRPNDNAADPRERGRGKKKGLQKSPSEPA